MTRAVLLASAIVTIIVTVVATLVIAADIFLILFLAVLFGVFLTKSSDGISRRTRLSYGWSLAVVTMTLLLVTVSGFAVFGVQVDRQITEAGKHFDDAQRRVQTIADRYPSVKSALASTPFVRDLVDSPQTSRQQQQEPSAPPKRIDSDSQNRDQDPAPALAASNGSMPAESVEQSALATTARHGAQAIAGMFRTTFGLVVNSVLIFFVGLFLAISPEDYRDGLVRLLPPARRDRGCEVMNLMGTSIWRWLIGRFGSMLVTGVGAGVLLTALGVPMGITIGVVTGILTFVPNIGSIVALLLAVLFALPQGGWTVQMVFAGYIVLQLIESYVITPMIQQSQVSLPPALLLSFQAIMGVVFGFLGAAVASPMLAASKTLIEEVYVKDWLER